MRFMLLFTITARGSFPGSRYILRATASISAPKPSRKRRIFGSASSTLLQAGLHFQSLLKIYNQPFTAPIITPCTRYFCTKGYNISTGRDPTTMVEYFSRSDIPWSLAAAEASETFVIST